MESQKNERGRPVTKDYYLEIQQKLADRRDNQGKRHELAFVVVLFLTSILRTDKLLNMSLIHRAMEDGWRELAQELGVKVNKCVSYLQLKRVIKIIDIELFNSINAQYFNAMVGRQGPQWHSMEGKELRGSIDGVLGQKRGQFDGSSGKPKRGGRLLRRLEGVEKPVVTAYLEQVGTYGRLQFRRAAHFPAQFRANPSAGRHVLGAGQG